MEVQEQNAWNPKRKIQVTIFVPLWMCIWHSNASNEFETPWKMMGLGCMCVFWPSKFITTIFLKVNFPILQIFQFSSIFNYPNDIFSSD